MRRWRLVALAALVVLIATAVPANATKGSGTSGCHESDPTVEVVWTSRITVAGGLLHFSVASSCAYTYIAGQISTPSGLINFVIAPGGTRSMGRQGLEHLGLYRLPATYFNWGGWTIGADSPCAYGDVEYLIEADGHVVANPCG